MRSKRKCDVSDNLNFPKCQDNPMVALSLVAKVISEESLQLPSDKLVDNISRLSEPVMFVIWNYSDVIMDAMASQITRRTIVYSTVYSGPDQGKHQSSASLGFLRGIHRDRWIPRIKGQLRGKAWRAWGEIMYPFLNFNGCTLEVFQVINDFILHLTISVSTYLCCDYC